MAKRTIEDVDVRGRRVLMRVDFNVPIEDGVILDDRHLRTALESIRSAATRGGRVILISHCGRPRGDRFEPDLSLRPCADRLGRLLSHDVDFVGDCIGPEVRQRVGLLRDGEVLLLENLRFHKEEVLGDLAFAKALADLADIYCNEAFPSSHRAHASLAGVPRVLAGGGAGAGRPKVIGLQFAREVRHLEHALTDPERPFVLVVGGDKAEDKIAPLLNLLDKVDMVLIGGALAYTFMAAEHKAVGESAVDWAQAAAAQRVLHAALAGDRQVVLPVDHVCGREASSATANRIADEVIPAGWMGLDIGPHTVLRYTRELRHARTIFWTGPMGVCATRPFDVGTKEVALAVAHATQIQGAASIVGGADTTALLQWMGLERSVTHLTMGGTATLAMLEGPRFESLALLDNREPAPRPATAAAGARA
jgi:3-phosphoglycerate kinase